MTIPTRFSKLLNLKKIPQIQKKKSARKITLNYLINYFKNSYLKEINTITQGNKSKDKGGKLLYFNLILNN